MDPTYLGALEATLNQTLAPDSAQIKQATQRLSKELLPNAHALPALVQLVSSASQDHTRHLAAVEARKLVFSAWEKTDPATKTQVREQVLSATFTQPQARVRHAAARVVAAIGDLDLDTGAWPELLPNLVKALQDASQDTRETAAYALYALVETNLPSLGSHVDDFIQLFGQLVADPSLRLVRVNAVQSMDCVAQLVEEDSAGISAARATAFKNTIPGMVAVLREVVGADDEEQARLVFNTFNSLAYVDFKLVGDNLFALVELMAEIAENTHLEEEYRVFGLQFLISCILVKKSKILAHKLGPRMTAAALRIALEDTEDPEEDDDDENENEESLPSSLALRLIASLASELPPLQVIQPLLEQLPTQLSLSAAPERRAVLLAVGVASLGAPDYYLTQISKLIPALAAGLRDGELIVRVAALRALSQLTSELQDAVADHHEQLLPLIIAIVDSSTTPRAYKYACFALDGLIEFMSHEAIAAYVGPLTTKLFDMLAHAQTAALRLAIVLAIGLTAYAGGKSFTPHFAGAIERLEPFASAATGPEATEDDIELRALTFENISTMARAVGLEAFLAYAKPLVEAAYALLESEHLRIRELGFAFISNMAKVYGAEFAGFLDQIVPQIIKCLGQEEFSFNANPGDDEEEELDDDNLDSKFNVLTGITIEKEIASVALAELALGTGSAFAPYVELLVLTLIEQIENSYGMREASMNALWKIACSMFEASHGKDFKAPKGVPHQAYVDTQILQLIVKVREITLEILKEEFDLTMVACILDNITEALQIMGPVAVLSLASETSLLETLCVDLMKILKNEHTCQMEDADETEDPEEEDDTSETEALLFESTLEVLIYLANTLQGDFVKVFASFKDVVLANVRSKSKNKRVSAIGALAEISSGIETANPYTEELLQVFIDRVVNDKLLEVRGNAAYGVGIVVEHAASDLSLAYPNILQLLFDLLNRADKEASIDDEETKDVVNRSYANACGCVARMTLKHETAVPLEHILSPLLAHLPLEAAFEENVPILTLLIKLYESGNALIAAHTEKVVNVLAQIFQKEAERLKLAGEATLGRESLLENMKQFKTPALRESTVQLLRFLEQKQPGVVSGHAILKAAMA